MASFVPCKSERQCLSNHESWSTAVRCGFSGTYPSRHPQRCTEQHFSPLQSPSCMPESAQGMETAHHDQSTLFASHFLSLAKVCTRNASGRKLRHSWHCGRTSSLGAEVSHLVQLAEGFAHVFLIGIAPQTGSRFACRFDFEDNAYNFDTALCAGTILQMSSQFLFHEHDNRVLIRME